MIILEMEDYFHLQQKIKKKIKLIPPKSVLERNKKKLDDIRKVKENEEKDTKTKQDAEIQRKQKELEVKRKLEKEREKKS